MRHAPQWSLRPASEGVAVLAVDDDYVRKHHRMNGYADRTVRESLIQSVLKTIRRTIIDLPNEIRSASSSESRLPTGSAMDPK